MLDRGQLISWSSQLDVLSYQRCRISLFVGPPCGTTYRSCLWQEPVCYTYLYSRPTCRMSLVLSPSLVYISLLLSVQCSPWHLDSLKSLECTSMCLHAGDHNFCLIFVRFGTWDWLTDWMSVLWHLTNHSKKYSLQYMMYSVYYWVSMNFCTIAS